MKVLLKKNILKNFKYLLLALPFIFFSCKKDPTNIGLNLQSNDYLISGNVIDTITIKAYTVREDSLSTDERSLALLGSYTDPIFGYTEASFLTQIRLNSSNVSFGNNPVADSIVIYLDYQSYYGDTTTPQTIEIYELEKSIYLDSTYYSNLKINNYIPNNKLIGILTYIPRPNDTCLAIKLSDQFAQKIVSATTQDLLNNDNFLNFFKGFYFKVQPVHSNGAIVYFNLLSKRSKVTLYYKNDNGNNKYDFVFNQNCARVNLFNHDYSVSQINSINDTTASDSILYIQAMAGLNIKIFFPFIKNFSNKDLLSFVKVELIIPVEVDNYSYIYKAPVKLLLSALNSDGKYEFLPDYYVNSDYFGGKANSSYTEYRFNISRYLQQIAFTGRKDYGIVLFAHENRVTANRVAIKGPKCKNGMRVVVTYLKP